MSAAPGSAAPSAEPDVPIVNYLRLADGGAHLEATACASCDARYFGRRIACSHCGGRSFEPRALPRTGHIATFTIVHRGAPGVATPFVSAIVVLDDGTSVKANVRGVEADPSAVERVGPVEITTFVAGVDDAGRRAIAFAFQPRS